MNLLWMQGPTVYQGVWRSRAVADNGTSLGPTVPTEICALRSFDNAQVCEIIALAGSRRPLRLDCPEQVGVIDFSFARPALLSSCRAAAPQQFWQPVCFRAKGRSRETGSRCFRVTAQGWIPASAAGCVKIRDGGGWRILRKRLSRKEGERVFGYPNTSERPWATQFLQAALAVDLAIGRSDMTRKRFVINGLPFLSGMLP